MRTLLKLAAICLLGCSVALAQSANGSTQPSAASQPSAQQQTGTAQQQGNTKPNQSSPSASGSVSASGTVSSGQSGPAGTRSDRNATANANGGVAAPAQPKAANDRGTYDGGSAVRRGGLPWGWVILGAFILLLIIIAVLARGSDHTTYVERERIERDHDDLRRAG